MNMLTDFTLSLFFYKPVVQTGINSGRPPHPKDLRTHTFRGLGQLGIPINGTVQGRV